MIAPSQPFEWKLMKSTDRYIKSFFIKYSMLYSYYQNLAMKLKALWDMVWDPPAQESAFSAINDGFLLHISESVFDDKQVQKTSKIFAKRYVLFDYPIYNWTLKKSNCIYFIVDLDKFLQACSLSFFEYLSCVPVILNPDPIFIRERVQTRQG